MSRLKLYIFRILLQVVVINVQKGTEPWNSLLGDTLALGIDMLEGMLLA